MRPAASPGRTAQVLRWLRWLVPAAVLVVSPTPVTLADGHDGDDDLSLDAGEPLSGPLSVADAIARAAHRR